MLYPTELRGLYSRSCHVSLNQAHDPVLLSKQNEIADPDQRFSSKKLNTSNMGRAIYISLLNSFLRRLKLSVKVDRRVRS